MGCRSIGVAVGGRKNVDGLVVFLLLVGRWVVFKAMRKGKVMWVLGGFLVVGVGFNRKMVEG